MKYEVKELINHDFFPENISLDFSKIFPAMIIATMSSGKSTLINALLGMDILPSQNAACTAKVYAVLDDDKVKKTKVYLSKKNGETTVVEENLSETLQKANQDNEIEKILISGQIKGVLNTDKALLLIDTPGPNNSGDLSHEAVMESTLEKLKGGLIIYIINATQMGISDDLRTLQKIRVHAEKHKDIKLLFVINKVDELDEEKESILDLIINTKEYLEQNEIKNPDIIPVSALAANLFKKAINGEEMTRNQYRDFFGSYELFEPKDLSMASYVVSAGILHNSKTVNVRGTDYTKEKLMAALDNTGLPYLEKYIQEAQILSTARIDMKIDIEEETNKIIDVTCENGVEFRISVVGDEWSGKSTIINALSYTDLQTYACQSGFKIILDEIQSTNSSAITRVCRKSDFIIYVMNANQIGINNETRFFCGMFDEIKKVGKLSDKKILFVINKCEELDITEGETVDKLLKNVKYYLENFGIVNPILIPISARLAQLIRKEEPLTREEIWSLHMAEDFVDEPLLHFEKYAAASMKVKEQIKHKIRNCKMNGDLEGEALIHTGIPVVEAVISEALKKYNASTVLKDSHDKTDILNVIGTVCKNFLSEDRQDEYRLSRTLKSTLGIGDEEVYLAMDSGLYKWGTSGFAITEKGVYARRISANQTTFMSFEELSNSQRISICNQKVYVGVKVIAEMSNRTSKDSEDLQRLFERIVRIIKNSKNN